MIDQVASNHDFRSGIAMAADWHEAIADVLVQLGEPTAVHRLGIFYVTHHFASSLNQIEVFLRQAPPVCRNGRDCPVTGFWAALRNILMNRP